MLVFIVCVAILSSATGVARNSVYRNLKGHKVVATWDEAQAICHREGAYLASPIDEGMLANMKQFTDSHYRSNTYFIGTRAWNSSGEYVSLEGVELEDMPVFDMLDRLQALEGDCLRMDEQTIRVVPCWTELPFICRLNATDDRLCGTEGYQYAWATDKCYKYYSTSRKTWDDAEATCVTDGGHLAVLDDNFEAETIHKLYIPSSRYYYGFLGFRDRAGNGVWTSNHRTRVEKLYNVWEEGSIPVGEPSRLNDCGVIRESGKIDNFPCKRTYPFISEKRPDQKMFTFKKTKQ